MSDPISYSSLAPLYDRGAAASDNSEDEPEYDRPYRPDGYNLEAENISPYMTLAGRRANADPVYAQASLERHADDDYMAVGNNESDVDEALYDRGRASDGGGSRQGTYDTARSLPAQSSHGSPAAGNVNLYDTARSSVSARALEQLYDEATPASEQGQGRHVYDL